MKYEFSDSTIISFPKASILAMVQGQACWGRGAGGLPSWSRGHKVS